MSVYAPLLGLGLVMIAVGIVMVLLSLRSRDDRWEVDHRAAGVIFVGPIPIVFGGRGRWTMVGIVIVAAIFLLMVLAMAQPDLIGW